MKTPKQLFLFLIPTLIVALVFVALSQQSLFVTDDSDYNSAAINADTPAKHLNHSNAFPVNFYILLEYGNLPALFAVGSIFVFFALSRQRKKLCDIKNHSPPSREFV